MRLSELRDREPFDAIVRSTLASDWSCIAGQQVRVDPTAQIDGQVWVENRILSAFHTRDASREVRSFMRDLYRFTPARLRALPQFVAATIASSSVAARHLTRPAFWVTPPSLAAARLLIVPGNERIRIFDFERQRARVVLKHGRDTSGTKAELALRAVAAPQWLKIEASDPDGLWFEEPLLHGYTLPRCPPWYARDRLRSDADELLSELHQRTASTSPARIYAEQLGVALPTAVDERLRDALLLEATRAGDIELVRSHGDYQAGNVFVERSTRRVVLIDWEYSGQRQRGFDALVLQLDSRHPIGLAARLIAFVEHGSATSLLGPGFETRAGRRSLCCLFLLEELAWASHRRRTDPSGPALLAEVWRAARQLKVL